MMSSGFWAQLRRDLAGVALLMGFAAAVGLAVNGLRSQPLPLVYATREDRMDQAVRTIAGTNTDAKALSPEPKPVARHISLEEFRAACERNDGLILDARPAVLYQLGHIPGALSLPRNDFEATYARLKSRLESAPARLLVVYCSDPDCEDSQMVGDALIQLGYSVSVFKGGWEAWTRAQLPEEKTP